VLASLHQYAGCVFIYVIYIWVVCKGAANVPYIYTAGVISRQQEQHARSYFFFSVAYTHSNVTPS
jgi:hypothetical protein